MCNELKNVYVIELDMKNKSVEDIAREAALQIVGSPEYIKDIKMERNINNLLIVSCLQW